MAISLPGYSGTGFRFSNGSVGGVVTAALPYAYVFAGFLLLIFLVYGGITLMTAGGDPGKSKQGYSIIANALIGFAIVFISYFVVQAVQTILGVRIF